MDFINEVMYNPYKIFGQDGKKYLYNVNNSGLYEIDEKYEKIFALEGKTPAEIYENIKDTTSKEEFEKIMQSLFSLGLIYTKNSKVEQKIYKTDLSALTLMVAQECNMRCSYCYGDGGEFNHKGLMTTDIAIQAVDFLIQNSSSSKLAIAFLGGEPLMNIKLIKTVVEYCDKKGIQNGKVFTYTITTNGTLITPEIESYLVTHKIVTQISIDGIKEKHDSMRYFANSKGSYEMVLDKTKSMRKNKLLTARATLSPQNLNYVEVFEHLNSLGFRAIPIEPAINFLSDKDKEVELNEYKKYLSYYVKNIKNKNFDVVEKMTDIIKAMEKIHNAGKRSNGCGAFKRMYAINIDGNIYPCHRFVGIPEFCLGNINDRIVDGTDFLRDLDVDNRKKCASCWAKNLCLGGCAYENYMENKNISVPSDNFCEHMKLLYEEVIKVFIMQKHNA